MDSERFDRLTMFVSGTSSRRAALRALAAGATGLGLIGAGVVLEGDLASAAKKGKNRKRTICHCGNSGDPQQCRTLRKKSKSAKKHLQKHCDYKGSCRDAVVNPCDPNSDCLPVIETEGDVTREDDGSFTTHAEGTVFGNLIFGHPAGTTFADLATMESDFDFSEGECGVGSPRFVVFLDNGRCPYAQFPPDLCDEPNAEGNTGNLIGNNTAFVWNDDLCQGNAANNTYDEVLAAYGTQTIDQIVYVHDSSSGTATVNVDPCITIAID